MPRMLALVFLFLIAIPVGYSADSFEEISFQTSDGGTIYANLYGEGEHAVVLAHGAVFDKESWDPLARSIADQAIQVLAIDFRGYGKSKAGKNASGRHLDLLAAIAYLSERGAKRVSLLGGSMGGAAAVRAAIEPSASGLRKLILLAPAQVSSPKKLQGDKLLIVSKGDGLHSSVVQAHKKASNPKRLLVLDGDAHAQYIFRTRHGIALRQAILDFLSE
jgi:alpha-beta hydrolase superfamily lysophospholipase